MAGATIIRMIVDKYNLTEKQALRDFYESATGASLSDDETGLYGQSPLYILGLYIEEKESRRNFTADIL